MCSEALLGFDVLKAAQRDNFVLVYRCSFISELFRNIKVTLVLTTESLGHLLFSPRRSDTDSLRYDALSCPNLEYVSHGRWTGNKTTRR